MITVGVIFCVSVIIVMFGPKLAAQRVLGPREKLSDDKLVGLFASSVNLPHESILMVLKAIGSGYGVDYSRLRPNDCFISQLSKLDSWRFDSGSEYVDKLLREKFNLTLPLNAKAFSILDLMKLIEVNLS